MGEIVLHGKYGNNKTSLVDDILENLPMLTDIRSEVKINSVSTKSKIKVLCLSIWYPMSISRYFEKALRHRDDVDLITTGPFSGSFIPWMGGMSLPEKYSISPDLPLPFSPNIGQVNYDLIRAQLPKEWIPDLIITIDAGICFKYKPFEGKVIHIATDPHCLEYTYQRTISDKFFNMQLCYSQKGDVYLPYAYSQYDHYPEYVIDDSVPEHDEFRLLKSREKDTDAVLIGMPYEQRVSWVNALRAKGISVIFENGPVFDEARALYNRGRIGLNWSSLNDLNARAFEIPAMKLAPVMNLVPDVGLFFEQGIHYEGFTELQGAIDAVLYLVEHPERARVMAEEAYKNIQGEHYDARIEFILKECGF